jgi:hypothetical protein
MGKPTVCIIYGVNEGPALGAAFRSACRQAGFRITNDPAKADIVIAHSGGCFIIPAHSRAKLIINIGVTYRPSRPLLISTIMKVWLDMRAHYQQGRLGQWPRKLITNLRYARKLSTFRTMLAGMHAGRPWNDPRHQIVVRNRHDAYSHPDICKLQAKGPRTFISFPGEHDDCWLNPERYVHLIQSLYG